MSYNIQHYLNTTTQKTNMISQTSNIEFFNIFPDFTKRLDFLMFHYCLIRNIPYSRRFNFSIHYDLMLREFNKQNYSIAQIHELINVFFTL